MKHVGPARLCSSVVVLALASWGLVISCGPARGARGPRLPAPVYEAPPPRASAAVPEEQDDFDELLEQAIEEADEVPKAELDAGVPPAAAP